MSRRERHSRHRKSSDKNSLSIEELKVMTALRIESHPVEDQGLAPLQSFDGGSADDHHERREHHGRSRRNKPNVPALSIDELKEMTRQRLSRQSGSSNQQLAMIQQTKPTISNPKLIGQFVQPLHTPFELAPNQTILSGDQRGFGHLISESAKLGCSTDSQISNNRGLSVSQSDKIIGQNFSRMLPQALGSSGYLAPISSFAARLSQTFGANANDDEDDGQASEGSGTEDLLYASLAVSGDSSGRLHKGQGHSHSHGSSSKPKLEIVSEEPAVSARTDLSARSGCSDEGGMQVLPRREDDSAAALMRFAQQVTASSNSAAPVQAQPLGSSTGNSPENSLRYGGGLMGSGAAGPPGFGQRKAPTVLAQLPTVGLQGTQQSAHGYADMSHHAHLSALNLGMSASGRYGAGAGATTADSHYMAPSEKKSLSPLTKQVQVFFAETAPPVQVQTQQQLEPCERTVRPQLERMSTADFLDSQMSLEKISGSIASASSVRNSSRMSFVQHTGNSGKEAAWDSSSSSLFTATSGCDLYGEQALPFNPTELAVAVGGAGKSECIHMSEWGSLSPAVHGLVLPRLSSESPVGSMSTDFFSSPLSSSFASAKLKYSPSDLQPLYQQQQQQPPPQHHMHRAQSQQQDDWLARDLLTVTSADSTAAAAGRQGQTRASSRHNFAN